MTKNLWVFIAAAIVIVLGIGGVAYFAQKGNMATDTATSTTKGPGYTITPIDGTSVLDIAPSLDHQVQFADSVPADARKAIQAHVDADVKLLKANPSDPGAWLDLAVWYNSADDYDAAVAVWEFMIKVAPQDITAYNNLGRHYHLIAHDYAKSESYFNQAIQIKPDDTSAYIELFQLYTLSYKKGTGAAESIIIKAEKQFPDNTDFPMLLAGYYRDQGRSADARVQYEKALAMARAQNNITLVTTIGNELNTLPK